MPLENMPLEESRETGELPLEEERQEQVYSVQKILELSIPDEILHSIAIGYQDFLENSDGLFIEELPETDGEMCLNPKKINCLTKDNTRLVLNKLKMQGDLYTEREIEDIIIEVFYYVLDESSRTIEEFHSYNNEEDDELTFSEDYLIKQTEKYINLSESKDLLFEAINRYKRNKKIIGSF